MKKEMRIGVVMASYLGDYPGGAKNREDKFIRAVGSFMSQGYREKELVIVADGCPRTEAMVEQVRKAVVAERVHLISLPKQLHLSGKVRQAGVDYAVKELGVDVVCYLDTDDYLEAGHLENIAKGFADHPGSEWIWFNDRIRKSGLERRARLEQSHVGTSNIAHRGWLPVVWGDGYGHDWRVVERLMKYRGAKCRFSSYMVCHIPNQMDL